MLSKNINFTNFKVKNSKTKTGIFIKKNIYKEVKNNKNLLSTLSKNYKYSYKKNFLFKYKKFKEFNLIGMGGSILGTESMYSFLKHKVKKKINFFNNLDNFKKIDKKKYNYF